MKDYICKTCRVHTSLKIKKLENGRYQFICQECFTLSPVFNKSGDEISHTQITKEKNDWR